MFKNKEGQKVPKVNFKVRENGEWKDLSSDELFNDQKVILFALPGAFTPTCSSAHLPRYDQLAQNFKDLGVDRIICLSVNDSFVMDAWKDDQDANNIFFLADGNAEFSDQMGLLVDKSNLGFGKRSWRYSMLVENSVIKKMFIEPNKEGDPFEVSDADTMLDYMNPNAEKPKAISIITKPGCPFCAKAKELLRKSNLEFEEIQLGKDATTVSLQAITGKQTVPQVYINGQHIGGSEDLEDFLS